MQRTKKNCINNQPNHIYVLFFFRSCSSCQFFHNFIATCNKVKIYYRKDQTRFEFSVWQDCLPWTATNGNNSFSRQIMRIVTSRMETCDFISAIDRQRKNRENERERMKEREREDDRVIVNFVTDNLGIYFYAVHIIVVWFWSWERKKRSLLESVMRKQY